MGRYGRPGGRIAMTLRFGTDGVRGVANRDLTPELVTALGRAAARVLGNERPFLVGRDTRRSGPMLEAALVAGLCSEGLNVQRVGVVPTPGLAHLAHVREAPAAMISASHNPFGDNGVKLFAPGGRKIPDADERRVEKMLRELAKKTPSGAPDGADVGYDRRLAGGHDEYTDHLLGALEGRRIEGVTVVVDCGHGAAFDIAPRAFEKGGATVEVRNARPDGTNINAGCGSTDPSELQEAVAASKADAGLAFDGDADRVIAVDEHGDLVDGDQMLAALALDLHDRGRLRGGAVVATVMSNLGLRRALEERGLTLVETPVGDRSVLAALEEHDLSLGGEQSGHVIFSDLATTGDGTLTGLLLLDLMVRTRQTAVRARRGRAATAPGAAQHRGRRPRRAEERPALHRGAVVRRVGARRGRAGARPALGHRAGRQGDGRGADAGAGRGGGESPRHRRRASLRRRRLTPTRTRTRRPRPDRRTNSRAG